MVEVMLNGFGGDCREKTAKDKPQDFNGIQCYHINSRFSENAADLGRFRIGKFFRVFRYCLAAIWCRFRYGVDTFYFVPAPPRRPSLYRDWLIMLICRPFFRRFIHHWHAVGVADWLRQEGTWISRGVTRTLLGKASLGIALATPNLRDALWLEARRVEIVHNGIPDPFPDFKELALPRRSARREARTHLLRGKPLSEPVREAAGADANVFRIVYLGYCFREKGIFEMLDGVALAQRRLSAAGHPLTLHLTIAGDFFSAHEAAEFQQRIAMPDLCDVVRHIDFVHGAEKRQLFVESDCLCFPTYCDSFGLVVLEAMAVGLNIIATIWGALPEILPPGYTGFVPVRDAGAIADRIPALFTEDSCHLRNRFLERFTEERHLARLQTALLSVERDACAAAN